MFLPLCSNRKAASRCVRRSKVCVGSPCSTPAAARCTRRDCIACIHSGARTMSSSIANTSYRTAARACCIRAALHTPRLPISSKAPPSPSSAVDAEMKSVDKLFSTRHRRAAWHARAAPCANVAASRELVLLQTPRPRSNVCLCRRPAVPSTLAPSQCAYSTATSPTPPTAAWISIACPRRSCAPPSAACTVLHVIGSVHAASKESAAGLGASHAAGPRVSDARLPTAPAPCHPPKPTAATPGPRCATPVPTSVTTPAQSSPGGPGSPGYSPSTLSTSRKLSPTACTRSSACLGGSGASKACCGCTDSWFSEPRPRNCSRIGPERGGGAVASRGTRTVPRRTSSSGSSPAASAIARHRLGPHSPSAQHSGSDSASRRAQRVSPQRPAPALLP
eukprot:scaffold119109_cov68-Phaeocystis_antarctica.AAC.6